MKRLAALPTPWIVVGSVAAAVAINLVVYAFGRMLGGTFRFTAAMGSTVVEPLTLIGFTAVPLAIGLAAVAITGRWLRWVFPVAMVVAPILELGSIIGMTLPADFDLTSVLTLAACHAMLVPVSLVAISALRRRVPGTAKVAAAAAA